MNRKLITRALAVSLVVCALFTTAWAASNISYGGGVVRISSAGNITVTPKSGGTFTLGSTGTGLTRVAKFTAALTPAEVATATCAEQLFTVTGIAAGDVVTVNKPTAQAGLGIGGVRASATNQVGITFCNPTGSGITPTAAETYLFTAIR